MQTLWTKNYTTITIGTIISAIGGVGINFALSVLIYNNTQSTLLSAIFAAVIMLPNFLLPLFVGPIIDRFSRKNIIVFSDFLMGFLFLFIAYATRDGYFNYNAYLMLGLVIASNAVVYQIAYESLFPELIPDKMMQKGYAISSLIYPTVNTVMFPVAALIFNEYGPTMLFLLEGVLLVIAALFETQIDVVESHTHQILVQAPSFKEMLVEGAAYLKQEKGLLAIFVFFFVLMMSGEGINVLMYPFFENHAHFTMTHYAWAISFVTIGRLIGGLLHYVLKVPVSKRYRLAAFVYFSLNVLNAILLYLPYVFILTVQVVIGILSINSFNIRMSSVQSYVPAAKRGRVNGFYQVLTASGMIIGRLFAGWVGEYFSYTTIIAGMSMVGLLAFFLIIEGNKKHVAAIYNRQV
ncbi:MAG: MFS transporter [Erysipelothrix sp.]|jgi:MFS family permease|nr:MFS transporter [Erysipelothrix sp.]